MSALTFESEENTNILFHIAHVEGLPARPGWTPFPGTYVSVEKFDAGSKENFDTEHKKITPGLTQWCENLPLLHVTRQTNLRFSVKHQALLNKRSVLGSSETFSVQDLLKLQKDADYEPDKLIKLVVALDQNATRGLASPRTPKSPRPNLRRSSFSGFPNVTRLSRGSLDVPTTTTTPNPLMSPIYSPTSPPGSPRFATLHLAIRETAMDPGMTVRANAANWKSFVETCRHESLKELGTTVQGMTFLRDTFEEDSNCVCLIDIILGALESTRKLLANPETMNVNRHIVQAITAINSALAPYQSLSQRRVAKRGETSIMFLQEVLYSVVNTLWLVGAIFSAKSDVVLRDRLETRLIAWADYFQQCTSYISSQSDQRPSLPVHKTTSTRVQCPKVLVANAKLPKHNMKTMLLPDVYSYETYDRPDVVRLLTEWVMLSSFTQAPSHGAREVAFAESAQVPDIVTFSSLTPPPPTSPRNVKKPAPLNLKEDNFQQSNEVTGILRKSDDEAINRNNGVSGQVNNVFCLSGPPKCGKTQLAARMCEWLSQMRCLGGYFSFDGSSETPSEDLDALTMTLIHQMSITEPDSVRSFNKALVLQDSILHLPLEQRFEALFVEPIRDFVAERSQGKFKVLDPLVFVIDGMGSTGGRDEDEAKTAKTFVDWICSTGIGRLPRHVKFIVLVRSETRVARLLQEKGLHGFEMVPIARFVEDVAGSKGAVVNDKWASNTSMTTSPLRANSY